MIKKNCIVCNSPALVSKRNIPALCNNCIEMNIRNMNRKDK